MTFYSYQIETSNPAIFGGRWFPIESHDGFPNRTPAEWATSLADLVLNDNRSFVEYRLVYVKRGQ